MRQQEITQRLFQFIKNSPTAFHTVRKISQELEDAGYEALKEEDAWEIEPGGRYYVTRNGSSIIAFCVGERSGKRRFHIVASHSDSPAFKIKENAELEAGDRYIRLNTEGYGGMLCSTWLDRPLSVAGRAVIRESGGFRTELVDFDRDLLLIPNLSIHMNRKANDGYVYNKQVDMLPLFGGGDCKKGGFKKLLAAELGASVEAVCASDLYLYNRQEPSVWGQGEEFISAPRLDDLQCAYAALQGFLDAQEDGKGKAGDGTVRVYACFDNEEVGSGTKQGAGSTFLYDVLRRISIAFGGTEEDYYRAVAGSFMVSADNAHAVHPNHPEKTDAQNCAYMNEGIVIKSHAGQRYTSDAVSIAVFKDICERADVPVQFFANRSDEPGGSTLGNISSGKVSLSAVDVGLAQLAMHSAYETAGIKDTEYMARAVREFFFFD